MNPTPRLVHDASARKDNTSKGSKPFEIKTYIVMQRKFAVRGDQPNVEVIDVKLTQAAAQLIVDNIPGTFIVRKVATK